MGAVYYPMKFFIIKLKNYFFLFVIKLDSFCDNCDATFMSLGLTFRQSNNSSGTFAA